MVSTIESISNEVQRKLKQEEKREVSEAINEPQSSLWAEPKRREEETARMADDNKKLLEDANLLRGLVKHIFLRSHDPEKSLRTETKSLHIQLEATHHTLVCNTASYENFVGMLEAKVADRETLSMFLRERSRRTVPPTGHAEFSGQLLGKLANRSYYDVTSHYRYDHVTQVINHNGLATT
ncbi:hypothetical protein BCR34DRAFT_601269 [Clohesyomyces aquaticus]|uniref:Uncharacterized protein n=1 Tax=Clohesyomyces aquaticus TaxID=1231657 RepID=A0A1Y1ZML2_9PLEO|nr:hypothetical protein BCR34DRAFT_601269 [Clohesyomyces aquaticus]